MTAEIGMSEQDNQERTAGKDKSGYDNQHRTIRQPVPESQDRTIETGQPGKESRGRTVRTKQQGRDIRDKTVRSKWKVKNWNNFQYKLLYHLYCKWTDLEHFTSDQDEISTKENERDVQKVLDASGFIRNTVFHYNITTPNCRLPDLEQVIAFQTKMSTINNQNKVELMLFGKNLKKD